ncbi:hypothetical protein ACE6H2_010348 [Prunus campanulata]
MVLCFTCLVLNPRINVFGNTYKLHLKGNAGSKWQHVHSCSLVQSRKLYGYHSSEEVYL